MEITKMVVEMVEIKKNKCKYNENSRMDQLKTIKTVIIWKWKKNRKIIIRTLEGVYLILLIISRIMEIHLMMNFINSKIRIFNSEKIKLREIEII